MWKLFYAFDKNFIEFKIKDLTKKIPFLFYMPNSISASYYHFKYKNLLFSTGLFALGDL